MNAQLLRDIQEEGYAGGILFEWVDEWFKLTWNTVDLELPADRRQLWRNDLTNEEQFGIVAAEPGAEPSVTLDGDGGEWEDNGSQVIAEALGPVREVRAIKDEQSLSLRLVLDDEDVLDDGTIVVGLDVRPGGNRGLPDLEGVYPEADVALVLGPGEAAKLWQAAWWEPTRIRYGLGFGYLEVDPADFEPESGTWVSPLQITSRPYVVPETGEQRPAELHDLGAAGGGEMPRTTARRAWPRPGIRSRSAAVGDPRLRRPLEPAPVRAEPGRDGRDDRDGARGDRYPRGRHASPHEWLRLGALEPGRVARKAQGGLRRRRRCYA